MTSTSRPEGDENVKIYIDGCDKQSIDLAEKFEIGITTNPTIIVSECAKRSLFELIGFFSQIKVPEIFLHVEKSYEEIVECLDTKKFVIKLPWVEENYELSVLLKKKGFRVCATAVYELSQLITALTLNVDFVAFYYDRASKKGIDPEKRICEFMEIISKNHSDTRVIVASLKNADQILSAVKIGVSHITIPVDLFKEFVKVPEYVLVDVRKFSEDLKKISISERKN